MSTPAKTNQNTVTKKKSKFKYTKWIVIGAIVLAVLIAAVIILPKVLGGVIGLMLSFGAVGIYKLFASSAVSMNWGVGFLAIAFCAVIGVLFGSYPAAKASRLQPIDALHTT